MRNPAADTPTTTGSRCHNHSRVAATKFCCKHDLCGDNLTFAVANTRGRFCSYKINLMAAKLPLVFAAVKHVLNLQLRATATCCVKAESVLICSCKTVFLQKRNVTLKICSCVQKRPVASKLKVYSFVVAN